VGVRRSIPRGQLFRWPPDEPPNSLICGRLYVGGMTAFRAGRSLAANIVLGGTVLVFSLVLLSVALAPGARVAPSSTGVEQALGVAPSDVASSSASSAAGAGDAAGAPSPPAMPSVPAADPVLPQVLTSIPVGTDPVMAAYDGANGLVYVANSFSDNVTVLNGTTVEATVDTGAASAGDPVYVAVDPVNGFVYVVDRYYFEGIGGAVSVINGTSLLATIPVGVLPNAASCDLATGLVYVTNPGSGNVTVLDGLLAVASIPVGTQPVASVYDAANGYVYVANFGSDTVSLLDGTAVLASIAVGAGPDALAYDPSLASVYVANNGSGNVTILSGLSTTASPFVGTSPVFELYDPSDGDVVVANANSSNATILSGTAAVATVATGAEPVWAAYDGSSEFVYLVAYGSASVTVVDGTSTLGTIDVGAYPTSAVWGTGHGFDYVTNSVSGNVSVIAAAYDVTFNETGLPVGSPWTVTLAGASANATTPSLAFAKLPGSYPYSIIGPASYRVLSSTPASPVAVTDQSVVVDVTFGAASSNTTYDLTFQETGLSSMCSRSIPSWSVTVGNLTKSSTTSSISFAERNGTYSYTIGAPSGYQVVASAPSSPVTIDGAPLTVEVTFGQGAPAQKLSITFQETGLPYGTVWCITMGSTVCSSSDQIVFSGLSSGTYTFSVGSVSGYSAEPSGGTVLLRYHSQFVQIRFCAESPHHRCHH
jgi:YVTN family beta-propeller protein